MTEESADQSIKVPVWLIRLCKWCWRGRLFLFGTIILNLIVSLVAALPLVDPSTLGNLPIAWLFAHWTLLLGLFLFLLVMTTLCGLIARLSAPLSMHQVRVRYLEQLIRDTE